MIANATTLILGGGASVDYGYPVGADLRQRILTDTSVHELLRKAESHNQVEQFLKAFDAVPLESIEHFLAQRPEYERTGTLAIAASLLPISQKPPKGGWYEPLYQKLVAPSGGQRQKLSIVSFNYDESLETYFLERFRFHFNTTVEEAQKHFDDYLSVVHVYGSLGGATFDPNAVDGWGRPAPGKALIKAANGIKILQHGDHTSTEFQRARRCIEQSEFICFLGFGFLEENVMRLQLATMPAKHIFASGLGITHGMRQRLKRQLRAHALEFGGEWDNCMKFLAETDFLGWASIPGAQASEAM